MFVHFDFGVDGDVYSTLAVDIHANPQVHVAPDLILALE